MGISPSKEWIETLYRKHHRIENLQPDPLVFTRGFGDPKDGEVAGLVAAAFAYGQVGKIMEALERIFAVLGPSPSQFLMQYNSRDLSALLRGFVYRFHKTEDVALFFHLLHRVLENRGGLRALFLEGDDEGDDLARPLGLFCDKILSEDARPLLRTRDVPTGHPVRFLLASPAGGGAAKRMCLFLRWMVRRDEIDPGCWFGSVDPARLVIPLDTHVARAGQLLGFTGRKTPDWKMAKEITQALKAYDPDDPIRYDFSLFRYGMSELAP